MEEKDRKISEEERNALEQAAMDTIESIVNHNLIKSLLIGGKAAYRATQTRPYDPRSSYFQSYK
ncbi:hypothetical protein KW805_01370 [Candidatus Pacearchaeota archaeon]|nr:hypothetical protein [Candidatus Pacearchaeota archaeon]